MNFPASHKTRLALIWLLVAAPVSAGSHFLDRLAAVESRGNNNALGQRGERGAWQLSRVAWSDVDRERARNGLPIHPHTSAHDPVIAREYAASYVSILSRRIRSHGIDPTEDRIGIAWNRGLAIALRTNFDGVNCPPATRRFLTSRKRRRIKAGMRKAETISAGRDPDVQGIARQGAVWRGEACQGSGCGE